MIEFTLKEKAAIYNASCKIILADNKKDLDELKLLLRVFKKLGTELFFPSIEDIATPNPNLPMEEVVTIIKNMSYAKKVFITQFLAAIMGVDGNIEEVEMLAFQSLVEDCNLPKNCVSEESFEYFYKNF